MKNILTILRDDLHAIRTNVITAVIIFGLAIIPLLFTSFNVLASWDPFANTDQLKIAVASEDEGHESDLASLKLNLGDKVLSQLSRNQDIDWVITDSADAVEGTKSGEYYAGIVLPKDFSADLLTFYVEGTGAEAGLHLFHRLVGANLHGRLGGVRLEVLGDDVVVVLDRVDHRVRQQLCRRRPQAAGSRDDRGRAPWGPRPRPQQLGL